MTQDEIKHLEMIQGVIKRLAGNSFLMKGWSVTLISALFVLSAEKANERYACVALLPALIFWGLDAFYLRLERLYRKLYDAVRGAPGLPKPEPFSMDVRPYAEHVAGWFAVALSRSILPLHLTILIAVVVVMLVAASR